MVHVQPSETIVEPLFFLFENYKVLLEYSFNSFAICSGVSLQSCSIQNLHISFMPAPKKTCTIINLLSILIIRSLISS